LDATGNLSALLNRTELSTTPKLVTLSERLESASSAISEVEAEIEKTKKLVDELEQKKNLYEQVVNTNREQVEAISLLLNEQRRQDEAKSFWIDTVIGLLINLAIMFVGFFLEYKVGFFRRWLNQPQDKKP
jgi:Fe2+ transport system protein B